MTRLTNGILRPFIGTASNVTGYLMNCKNFERSSTGFSRATSAIMRLAITGTYPDFAISYPLELILRGSMPPTLNAATTLSTEGNLLFSRTDNSGTGTAKTNDKAILVAYFPALHQIVYSLGGALGQIARPP